MSQYLNAFSPEHLILFGVIFNNFSMHCSNSARNKKPIPSRHTTKQCFDLPAYNLRIGKIFGNFAKLMSILLMKDKPAHYFSTTLILI